MAISMLVLIPLGELAKDIVARPRPEIPKADVLIPAAHREGLWLSFWSCRHRSSWCRCNSQYLEAHLGSLQYRILAIEAALVCISKVYVGGHYPLDVIGGILLRVAVSFIFVGIQKHIESLMVHIIKIV
jgi:undecaprenyl-diphosphatase